MSTAYGRRRKVTTGSFDTSPAGPASSAGRARATKGHGSVGGRSGGQKNQDVLIDLTTEDSPARPARSGARSPALSLKRGRRDEEDVIELDSDSGSDGGGGSAPPRASSVTGGGRRTTGKSSTDGYCTVCKYASNDPDAVTCECCDQPLRPWACKVCTYTLNGPTALICKMCDNPLRTSTTATSSGQQQWVCQVCTYGSNGDQADECEVCGTRRHSLTTATQPPAPPTSAAPPPPQQQQQQQPALAATPALAGTAGVPIMWTCACTHLNAPAQTFCARCFSPRPAGAILPRLGKARPVPKKKAGFLASVTAGLFGAAKPSTASSLQDLMNQAAETRHFELMALEPLSAEYAEVCRHVGDQTRIRSVTKVVRCFQNPRVNGVRQDYQERGLMVNPRLVWHGTDIGAIHSILSKGFAVPPQARNGRAYGHGIYLSPITNTAQSMGYCHADKTGVRHMLLCHLYAHKTEALTANGSWQVTDPEAEAAESAAMLVVFQAHCNTALLPAYILSF